MGSLLPCKYCKYFSRVMIHLEEMALIIGKIQRFNFRRLNRPAIFFPWRKFPTTVDMVASLTSALRSVRILTTHLCWGMLKVKLTTPFTLSSCSSTRCLDAWSQKKQDSTSHRCNLHMNGGRADNNQLYSREHNTCTCTSKRHSPRSEHCSI